MPLIIIIQTLEDNIPLEMKSQNRSNHFMKSPWLQTHHPSTQLPSEQRTDLKQTSLPFHSQTLPRPPKGLPEKHRSWLKENNKTHTSEVSVT